MTPTSPCAFPVSDSISARPLTCTREASYRASTWLYTTAYKSLCGTWSNSSRPFIRIFCTCAAMDGRSGINRLCVYALSWRHDSIRYIPFVLPAYSLLLKPEVIPLSDKERAKATRTRLFIWPLVYRACECVSSRSPLCLSLACCSQSLHCLLDSFAESGLDCHGWQLDSSK